MSALEFNCKDNSNNFYCAILFESTFSPYFFLSVAESYRSRSNIFGLLPF